MASKNQFLIKVIWQRWLEREREGEREREKEGEIKKRRNIEIIISTKLMRIWEVNNLTIASTI